jgi:hypothetical protein
MQVHEWQRSCHLRRLHVTPSQAATSPHHLRGLWKGSTASNVNPWSPDGGHPGLHIVELVYNLRGRQPEIAATVRHQLLGVFDIMVGPVGSTFWSVDVGGGDAAALPGNADGQALSEAEMAVNVCGLPWGPHGVSAAAYLSPAGEAARTVAAAVGDARPGWRRRLIRQNSSGLGGGMLSPPSGSGLEDVSPRVSSGAFTGRHRRSGDDDEGLRLLMEGINTSPSLVPGASVSAAAQILASPIAAEGGEAGEGSGGEGQQPRPRDWEELLHAVRSAHRNVWMRGQDGRSNVLFELALGAGPEVNGLLLVSMHEYGALHLFLYTRLEAPCTGGLGV